MQYMWREIIICRMKVILFGVRFLQIVELPDIPPSMTRSRDDLIEQPFCMPVRVSRPNTCLRPIASFQGKPPISRSW